MLNRRIYFLLEIVHRLHDWCTSTREVHAKRSEQFQIQSMENSRFNTVRVFYYDAHCVQHPVANDEGKILIFSHLLIILTFFTAYFHLRQILGSSNSLLFKNIFIKIPFLHHCRLEHVKQQ